MPRIKAIKYPGVTAPVKVRPSEVVTVRDLAQLRRVYAAAS